jgi:hypothetical protein
MLEKKALECSKPTVPSSKQVIVLIVLASSLHV